MQTEQDLEKLVRAYTAPLLRYCTALLGSAQDAQDAVQTTFVKAWLHRGSLRGGGQDNITVLLLGVESTDQTREDANG